MRKFFALLFAFAFAVSAHAQSLTGYPPPGQLPGTGTNDSAIAGNVGQYVESSIPSGSAVTLTTATAADLTTISLTAGDWDVQCSAIFLPAATTTVTLLEASLNTSAAANLTPGFIGQAMYPSAATGANYFSVSAGPARVSLSATTTYHCVVYATFGTSTMQVFGLLRARRVR